MNFLYPFLWTLRKGGKFLRLSKPIANIVESIEVCVLIIVESPEIKMVFRLGLYKDWGEFRDICL